MTRGLELLTELAVAFALCYVGKWMYAWIQRWPRLDHELTARDNTAFAVPLGAYYLGLFLLLAGSGSGVANVDYSLSAAVLTGLVGLSMLNIGMRLMDHLFFRGLNLHGRILNGRSLPAGTLMGGSHLACALVVWGALADRGGWLATLVFWLYGQAILMVAGRLFCTLGRYRLSTELRRGNLAVAISVAGSLIAIANIVRLSLNGPFDGWSSGLAASTGYALAGVGILLIIRKGVDWLLLPGVTIRHEIVRREVPNIGIGFLLAIFYVGLSILVGWIL